jgi:hypothetical protein
MKFNLIISIGCGIVNIGTIIAYINIIGGTKNEKATFSTRISINFDT